MSATNMNPQPKARFMAEASNITHHKELVSSRPFERGCDFAMLQYQAYLGTQSTDGNTAMCAGLKLQGALEFLSTLRTLAETPEMPKPRTAAGLDHKV